MSKKQELIWDPVTKKYVTKIKEPIKIEPKKESDEISISGLTEISGKDEDYKYSEEELDKELDASCGIITKSSSKKRKVITDTDSEYDEYMNPKPVTCPTDKIKELYLQLKKNNKALTTMQDHISGLEKIAIDIYKDMKRLKKELY